MTITYPEPLASAAHNVYQPQDDSWLLVDAMYQTALIPGRRVLDLCTGSGFVAIAAAEMGCVSVTAFDICPHAVHCSRGNAAVARVEVDVREGSWMGALDCAPFDVVVANPPYVPTPPGADTELICSGASPSWAWNAGSLLLVHSALAGVQQSLDCLRSVGMDAEVIASKWIPFGPVMSSRANWLEDTGRIPRGRREEELVVIRADKP
ncbi:class I SAM-dependent methyltransferase [Mycobacterium sp.]|uniref:class I SAM-dependent methyltransferase n=1 Tax=Mycobacterium sp. TaxID=1785 RepID=UPI003C70C5CD